MSVTSLQVIIVIFIASVQAYKLVNDASVDHYDIHLTFPDFREYDTFDGETTIHLTALQNITSVSFHSSAEFINIKSITIANETCRYKSDSDVITVKMNIIQPAGTSYSVVITYTGKISASEDNGKLHGCLQVMSIVDVGVFKKSYQHQNGTTSTLLATQFQPIFARRSFPCLDEPALKATFNVSISYYHDETLPVSVVFNTDIVNTDTVDDVTTVTFATTPKMSTYLLYFVISDFTSTSTTTNIQDGTTYFVWSRDDAADSRAFALQVGADLINYFIAFTGKNLTGTITKSDQVAIPDFTGGVKENWGLILYPESNLLWDTENSPESAKKPIATIIAHELSHQWFGNLITFDWWSEAFLNEAFASYFEYFATCSMCLEWELDKLFIVNVLQQALLADSMEQKALKSDVSSDDEVNAKFDIISHGKGAAILRMLAEFIGEESFKNGIQTYVNTEELQSATSTSTKLWEIIGTFLDSQYAGIDVPLTEIMENWVSLPGYPLIEVELLKNGALQLSQERFLLSNEESTSKWYVPITYIESEDETKYQTTLTKSWLTPSTPTVTINLEHNNSWILVNTKQIGFYRVNYDTDLWQMIAKSLQLEDFGEIAVENRAHIVDDAFNIAKINKLTYPQVFDIIEFVANDTSYFTWIPTISGFEYLLQKVTSGSKLKTKIEEHLLSLLVSFYEAFPLNTTQENVLDTLAQILAGSWACKLGEESCVDYSISVYNKLSIDTKPHKNIRSVVYCNGLRYTNNADILWELYDQSTDSTEKLNILTALGCSSDADQLKSLLEDTIANDSKIRSQDVEAVFKAVYEGSDEGIDVALEFLANNFNASTFDKLSSLDAKANVLRGIATRLTTSDQISKFKEFIASHEEFLDNLLVLEVLETVQTNVEWRQKYESVLKGYYGIKSDDSSTGVIVIVNLWLIAIVLLVHYVGNF